MNANDLRFNVIRPVLVTMGTKLWSEVAEALLLGTCAVESDMGTFLKQTKGPARGIYQIEPATAGDVLARHGFVGSQWLIPSAGIELQLTGNLLFQTAIARLIYYRDPTPLPATLDPYLLGEYWKQGYNTKVGKGTVELFVQKYQKYVK